MENHFIRSKFTASRVSNYTSVSCHIWSCLWYIKLIDIISLVDPFTIRISSLPLVYHIMAHCQHFKWCHIRSMSGNVTWQLLYNLQFTWYLKLCRFTYEPLAQWISYNTSVRAFCISRMCSKWICIRCCSHNILPVISVIIFQLLPLICYNTWVSCHHNLEHSSIAILHLAVRWLWCNC